MNLRHLLILVTMTFLLPGQMIPAQGTKPNRQTVEQLSRVVASHYQAKEYQKGVTEARKAIALIPELQREAPEDVLLQILHWNIAYNGACMASLAEDADGGFALLEEAVRSGFHNIEHMKKDADLATLRKDSARWAKAVELAEAEVAALASECPPVTILTPALPKAGGRLIVALQGAGQDIKAWHAVLQGVADRTQRHVIAVRGTLYAGGRLFYWDEEKWQQAGTVIVEAFENARDDLPNVSQAPPTLLGYSQGGAIAWTLTARAGRDWGGVVTYGAYLPPPLVNDPNILKKMSTPIFAIRGTTDTDLVTRSQGRLKEIAQDLVWLKYGEKLVEGAGHPLPSNAVELIADGLAWVGRYTGD